MIVNNDLRKRRLVFIGAGNMAEALVRGLLKAGLCTAESIRVTDVDRERLSHFESSYNVAGLDNNAEAVKAADIVVLAVKPQVIPDVLNGIKKHLSADALTVSIAAGVTTRNLEAMLGKGKRVIRVMPNTPALVGAGASAFCCGKDATENDARLIEALFQSVGVVVRLDESLMDGVTALSGSGPAYVFYLVEAMLEAAREMGLEQETARALTIHTIKGSARLLSETGLEPAELRRRVTSKGGTTEAALEMLDKARVQETLVAAIKAAQNRSKELSQ